jgi:uncharacterized protein (TIGR02246 family)
MEHTAKEQIETLLGEYKNALNTSNAQKAVSLYAKDGAFMPSEAPTAIGTEKILGAYEYIFSQIQLNIEFFIKEIVIENEFSFATTTSKGTVKVLVNGQTLPEENRELFVFKKVTEKWKIARYMFNKIAAPVK